MCGFIGLLLGRSPKAKVQVGVNVLARVTRTTCRTYARGYLCKWLGMEV